MQQRGHRPHLVEQKYRRLGAIRVHCSSMNSKVEVLLDLFHSGAGYPPMVHSVTPRPTVACGEFGRNGVRRTDHLVGFRIQGSRRPWDELDGDPRCLASSPSEWSDPQVTMSPSLNKTTAAVADADPEHCRQL